MSNVRPIESVEEAHPLLWLMYGVAFFAAIGVSAMFAREWFA